MANYNFTGDVAFKEKLIRALEKNELSGLSPYKLFWANTAESGWSFGVVQYDLGQSDIARTLFKQILLDAKDTQGNYLIHDSDALTGRANDKTVADLFNKAQTLGGQGLTADERTLIDSALNSTQGRALIDGSYNEYFDNDLFPNKVQPVLDGATGSNLAFLQTDLGKIFVADFSNQFGTSNVNRLKNFVAGQSVATQAGGVVKQRGTLGVDDLLNFYFRTNYAQTTNGLADQLRRFGNIVEQTGYVPESVEEAKDVFRVSTEVIIPQKDNIATKTAWQTSLDNFAAAVLDPARDVLVADLNTTQNLYLNSAQYLSTDVYIDPGRADSTSAYNPNYSNANLTGSDRNDIILGEGGNDTLIGGAGNDVLVGGPEAAGLPELASDNDILDGGEGDDILIGGAGNDTLYSGTGTNWLYGGTGNDTYYITAEAGSTTIAEDTQGSDTYIIHGAPGASVNITDSDGADTYRVYGGATVHINGATADDKIYLNSDTPVTMLFQQTAGQNVWKSEDGTITATHDSKNGNQQRMRMAA